MIHIENEVKILHTLSQGAQTWTNLEKTTGLSSRTLAKYLKDYRRIGFITTKTGSKVKPNAITEDGRRYLKQVLKLERLIKELKNEKSRRIKR